MWIKNWGVREWGCIIIFFNNFKVEREEKSKLWAFLLKIPRSENWDIQTNKLINKLSKQANKDEHCFSEQWTCIEFQLFYV